MRTVTHLALTRCGFRSLFEPADLQADGIFSGISYGDDGCAATGQSGWGSFRVVCLCEKCDEACLTSE